MSEAFKHHGKVEFDGGLGIASYEKHVRYLRCRTEELDERGQARSKVFGNGFSVTGTLGLPEQSCLWILERR